MWILFIVLLTLYFRNIFNWIYFLYFYCYFWDVFSLSFRIFISNSIFELATINSNFSATNLECLRCSQIWLASAAKNQGGNYRSFTYDALLSLVSIHDRRSPHRIDLPSWRSRGKKRRMATCRVKPWSRGKCRARRNDARTQLPQNSMDTVCWALLIPCGRRLPGFFMNSSDKGFLLRVYLILIHVYAYDISGLPFPFIQVLGLTLSLAGSLSL